MPRGHSYLIDSKPRKFLDLIFFIVCIESVTPGTEREVKPRLNTYHRSCTKGNVEELGQLGGTSVSVGVEGKSI